MSGRSRRRRAGGQNLLSLFPEAVPKLRNGQALAHATGYAYDRDDTLVYAGLVGSKTGLESLRATLMANKAVTMAQDCEGDLSLATIDRYEHVRQALPLYTSHHAAFISRLALPGKWEPGDQVAYALVFRGTANPLADLKRLFTERVKEALEISVLDDWADLLWEAALKNRYVEMLNIGGNCILGARLAQQSIDDMAIINIHSVIPGQQRQGFDTLIGLPYFDLRIINPHLILGVLLIFAIKVNKRRLEGQCEGV